MNKFAIDRIVDWTEIKKQKVILLDLITTYEKTDTVIAENLKGVLNLITNNIQENAIESGLWEASEVFGDPLEEEEEEESFHLMDVYSILDEMNEEIIFDDLELSEKEAENILKKATSVSDFYTDFEHECKKEIEELYTKKKLIKYGTNGFTVNNVAEVFANSDLKKIQHFALTDKECEVIFLKLSGFLSTCDCDCSSCSQSGLVVIEREIERFINDFNGDLHSYENE